MPASKGERTSRRKGGETEQLSAEVRAALHARQKLLEAEGRRHALEFRERAKRRGLLSRAYRAATGPVPPVLRAAREEYAKSLRRTMERRARSIPRIRLRPNPPPLTKVG